MKNEKVTLGPVEMFSIFVVAVGMYSWRNPGWFAPYWPF
jgi:hypothetical protein